MSNVPINNKVVLYILKMVPVLCKNVPKCWKPIWDCLLRGPDC